MIERLTKFKRRGVLENIGWLAAALAITELFNEAVIRAHTPETIRDFSTLDTNYRFLGGIHGSPEDQTRITRLRKEHIPPHLTIWQFETGDNAYITTDIKPQDYGEAYYNILRVYPFAQQVTQELTEKRLPLVLTDVPPPNLDPKFITSLGYSLAPAIGLSILADREQRLTRRRMLNAASVMAVGMGLMRLRSQRAMSTLYKVAPDDWAKRVAELNHDVELSQPDHLTITFRNAVIAAKNIGLENRFPKDSQTGKAGMLMIFGSGHLGLPEYVETGKQNIVDYLSRYPKFFIRQFFGENNPHLYTSVVITPSGNSFTVEKVEDPDLRKIFG